MSPTSPLPVVLAVLLGFLTDVQAARILPVQATLHLEISKNKEYKYLPIVMWHGMGDSCCSQASIGQVGAYIQDLLEGQIFVHSLATGPNSAQDILSSYFGSVDEQVDRVCDEIRSIPELQGGYVGIGFSQGGQFLRAVVQRCQHRGPVMHSLITMGSQHQGIMDIPGCWQPSFNVTPSWGCRLMQNLLGAGAYFQWVQLTSVQAQYFKDPARLVTYAERSAFLADVNVEADGISATDPKYKQYKSNLSSLQRFVLFQFEMDNTVVPKESAHFGFFDGQRLIPLQESSLYQEDRLGLKALDEEGRLVFGRAPGSHMQFTLEWFGECVVHPYLAIKKTVPPISYRYDKHSSS